MAMSMLLRSQNKFRGNLTIENNVQALWTFLKEAPQNWILDIINSMRNYITCVQNKRSVLQQWIKFCALLFFLWGIYLCSRCLFIKCVPMQQHDQQEFTETIGKQKRRTVRMSKN